MQISTNYALGKGISAVTLNENRVFIVHSYGGSYYLYGVIVDITGTTITVVSGIQLNSIHSSGYAISAVTLNDNKVFIAYSYGSGSYYLSGMICTIEGTTITVASDIRLSTVSYSGSTISAVALSEGRVFIGHGNNDNLYGTIIAINEASMTVVSNVQISNNGFSGHAISAVALSENRVFIAHSNGGYYYLSGVIIEINGTEMTAGNDVELSTMGYSGYTISILMLSNNIVIAHSYETDYKLRLTTNMIETSVNHLESNKDIILGVAQQKGTAGQLIKVVIPNRKKEEN